VQVDDGPWVLTDLADSLSDNSWRLWKLDVDLAPGAHTARVRATDGTGYTQTDERANPRPSGATGYHIVDFTAKPQA